jgi:hypothetical protein
VRNDFLERQAMAASSYIIEVQAQTRGEEAQGARALARVLNDIGVEVRQFRADPSTMDSGSALQFLVASPGDIPEVGRAIADWLRRTRTFKITVQTDDGTLGLIDATTGADVAEQVKTVLAGARLNRVITGTGNVITSGAVSGVVPIEPWSGPKKSSR